MGNTSTKYPNITDKSSLVKFPYSGSQDNRWTKMGITFKDIGDKRFVGVDLPSTWYIKPNNKSMNDKIIYILYDNNHRDIAYIYFTQSSHNFNYHIELNDKAVNEHLQKKLKVKRTQPKDIPKNQPLIKSKTFSKGISQSPHIKCNGRKIKINRDYKIMTS